mmetsp:Transcript_65503/g.168581  ORF Transcript_65503/g.168581 Transcript_65503/m.168581 type:complete len:277 (+) Transcript_65503:458-1288(+)
MVSASKAFLAWTPTMASESFSSWIFRRASSTCFLCSPAIFRAASFLRLLSSDSCLSSTLHHSPRNFAVSASSARSRSRAACLRWIWAARLRWMSSPHRRSPSSLSRRLRSFSASFARTWFSTRSSSALLIAARCLACASIIALRPACFCWNTSSSLALRSASIFSFLAAYSWIFSSSRCMRSESSALICFRYVLACCVSFSALTAWPRFAFSATFSSSRSSIPLRLSSSPSSIWSSTSRNLFSLYSASCSFCALAVILESSSLASFSFISRSSILR